MLSQVKPLVVDMELLSSQITLTNGAIDKATAPLAKEYLNGLLEFLVTLEETLNENNGVAIVMTKE